MRRARENLIATHLYLLVAAGPIDHPKVTCVHRLDPDETGFLP
jgi:hypothetical protein